MKLVTSGTIPQGIDDNLDRRDIVDVTTSTILGGGSVSAAGVGNVG